MAVGSQLALSARRREAGNADLAFRRGLDVSKPDADWLRAMTDRATAELDSAERVPFEAALAAKLLELAGYLPYQFDPRDIRFMNRALRAPGMPVKAGNIAALSTTLTKTPVRLCVQGRLRDALKLLPWRRLPEFLARLSWTIGLPRPARRTVRAVLRRLGTRFA